MEQKREDQPGSTAGNGGMPRLEKLRSSSQASASFDEYQIVQVPYVVPPMLSAVAVGHGRRENDGPSSVKVPGR
ncbi:hypothetical protein CVT25_011239 [Psilocybe cyanescens]|uniref:Uncharacterized protein n=1 Tax=Psilocybe cyanescens TaxID=93625 RepID=A0A409WGK0_PSICY|nr:hypothetical protein CVT25_011239 [Psilocybe cyanescens]